MNKQRKKSSKVLNFVGGVACGLASLISSGCQAPKLKYNSKPESVGALCREVGRTANCLDAKMPRTYSESGKKLWQGVSKIPKGLAKLADSVTGFLGVRFFEGRYFGQKVYEGIESGLGNFEGDVVEDGLKCAAIHVPDSLVNVAESVGGLVNDVYGTGRALTNLVILTPPLTLNTDARKQLYDKGKLLEKFSPADNGWLVVDGIADVAKAPLRFVLCLDDSGLFPDSWKYALAGARAWGGVSVDREQKEKLRLKLTNTHTGGLKGGRVLANSVPVLDGVLDGCWGTTHIWDPDGDFKKVADTIGDSIPARGLDDSKWYDGSNDAKKMPGIVRDGKFHPARSWTFRIGNAVKGALSFISSGGGGGSVAGGGRGGGAGGR